MTTAYAVNLSKTLLFRPQMVNPWDALPFMRLGLFRVFDNHRGKNAFMLATQDLVMYYY